MLKVAVGVKKGMTQLFKGSEVIPVTVVEVYPNTVVGVREKEKNGYSAIQLAYGEPKEKDRVKKTILGQVKKAFKDKVQDKIKEFRIETTDNIDLKIGDKITVEIFQEGEKVAVQGFTKGRGFQGVIKRHGFRRGPETHGSDHHRRPGAIGMCSFPARVFKGKKMPGRMGSRKVTIKNLEVVAVDKENNLLFLKGAVPGPRGNYIAIKGESRIETKKQNA